MTSRRVNALEYVLIPRIEDIIHYITQDTWAGHTWGNPHGLGIPFWGTEKNGKTHQKTKRSRTLKNYIIIQHSIVFLVEGREGTVLQEMDEQAREEFFRVKKALASEDFLSGWCHHLFGFYWILQKHELCGEDLKSSCFFG